MASGDEAAERRDVRYTFRRTVIGSATVVQVMQVMNNARGLNGVNNVPHRPALTEPPDCHIIHEVVMKDVARPESKRVNLNR